MTEAAFRDLVRRMRAKQREYFKSRTDQVLRECKDLERRVDEALTAEAQPTRSLFDAQPSAN